MKNEFQKHKKSDAIKWIVIFTSVLLLAVMLTAVITSGFKDWNPYGWLDKKAPQTEEVIPSPGGVTDENGKEMDGDTVYAMSSKMSFSAAALAASEGQGVSVTINATVSPADADNKLVDWSVEWLNAPNNGAEEVTDFVNVVPLADGSTTAIITCYKAFVGDTISVIVTTREGGFSADCVVSFVGHPSSLAIDTSSATIVNDAGWNVPVINLKTKTTYDYALSLSNAFGVVDSSITPNYTVELLGVGNFNINRRITGAVTDVDDIVTVSMTDKVIVGLSQNKEYKILSSLMGVTIENNNLHIITYNVSVGSYSYKEAYDRNRVTYTQLKFASYPDENKKPYLQIKVTETNTGYSQIINVRTDSSVTSVSLSNQTLSF